MQYAKTVLQILASVASAAAVVIANGEGWSVANILNVTLALVMAIGVFYVPNGPSAPVAKSVIAGLSAVLTLAVTYVAGGFTTSEILQIVVAALGALGVYGIKNSPPAVNA